MGEILLHLQEDLRQSNEITASEISAEEHFLTEELKGKILW